MRTKRIYLIDNMFFDGDEINNLRCRLKNPEKVGNTYFNGEKYMEFIEEFELGSDSIDEIDKSELARSILKKYPNLTIIGISILERN